MKLLIPALAISTWAAIGSALRIPSTSSSGSDLGHIATIDELKPGLHSPRHFNRLEQRNDPEFVEEFNVQTSTPELFSSLIERLRRRVQDRDTLSHSLPVLPPQQNPPNRWFDLVLRTQSQAMRFRIRMDNLYLDGYRAEASDHWYEFNPDPGQPQLIPGSALLGFRGGYPALEAAAAEGHSRTTIPLGRQQLINAVNSLARSRDDDHSTRARGLIVVIQMISEAMRFTRITTYISDAYLEGIIPDGNITGLENGWGRVSAALLHHDQNPETFRLPQPNPMHIGGVADAIAVLGMLLRYNINGGSRPRRQVQALIPEGRPLVEILWVVIDNIDQENPGDLYGTITATDSVGTQDIYNIDKANPQSIRPRDPVALSGPSRAISAADSFLIDLNLMDHDSDPSPEDEVSRGQIDWNYYSTGNLYDTPIHTAIKGKYGQATVNYIVMSNAAEAVVEVVLINGDNENPADIFGTLKVTSRFVSRELFNKAQKDSISVRPGESIPLSRAVMAVPLDDTLVVRADLWDYDPVSNDEVAKGVASLRPQVLHSTKERIRGQYGEVEVRVTWS
ncbi:hypothetical protein JDV02_000037 [Purpureocillium takamizusanense]|uniref:rRNA N-glycosylase n=1 Tax=Purpureocillium takamizusanense TaxID=2060973 RepID=A0A9Q8V528_9HYPO|nr:uncharacterized protein JDV02_000037 [Purpureocillium takamizusanense]UNI13280.1 hypothetical protein JDV02_000037 [Purpureocillium takamizusanense]